MAYCTHCGRPTKKVEIVCDSCRNPVDGGVVFCPDCGGRMGEGDPPSDHCHVRIVEDRGTGRDWLTTLLLCLFFGGLGVHRFYTGHVGAGIIQVLTVGGFGIWWLLDVVSIARGRYRDRAGNLLDKPL